MNNQSKTVQTTGLNQFLTGLLCFLLLGYDALQLLVDNLVFKEFASIDTFSKPWYVLVFHWTCVIIVWTFFGLILFKSYQKSNPTKKILLKWHNNYGYIILLAILSAILLTFIEERGFINYTPQIIREYRSFRNAHQTMGFLVSIFQNLYYIVEVFLVMLLLSFMQIAGELWYYKIFKTTKVLPFGSLGLMLTWGLGHLTHGGLDTLWISLFAFLLGLFYIISKKYYWPSYILTLLIFIL